MTYFNYFSRIFGDNSTSNAQRKQRYFRSLRIEELESREMLSVTLGDFDVIREQYADLNLSANMADYNIIEVGGAGDQAGGTDNNFAFSDAGIRAAIDRAGQTTGNDLIVVRTTVTQNKITLGGTELAININAATRGSVTIVSLGTENLTLDANQQSRIFNIGSISTVALAGLTITHGRVTSPIDGDGSGIRSSGALMITNCTISWNTSSSAYAIYNYCDRNSSTLTITNSMISGNTSSGNGGGILNECRNDFSAYTSVTTTLTIINCTISGNASGVYGSEIRNETVTANASAILSVTNSTINCTISGHTTSAPASIINLYSILTITDCEISGNTTPGWAGISNQYGISTITNSTISGFGGGGISNFDGTMTVTNSMIFGNTTSGNGGGINNNSRSTLTITNCTITGNTASGNGGGIYNGSSTSTLYMNNTIVAENFISDIYRLFGTVQGSNNLTSYFDDDANCVYNPDMPLFVDVTNGNYRLAPNSQALNRGDNDLAVDASGDLLTTDLDGNARIMNGTVDIGAYEYQGTVVVNPPTAPANFKNTDQTDNSVTLTWTAQSGLTGYTLEYKKSMDTTWLTWIPAPGVGATGTTITGLTANTPYDFQLTATNVSGFASSTTSASTEAESIVVNPPTAPAYFRSNAQTTNSVTLLWDAQSDLIGYTLQYRVKDAATWETVTPAPGASATGETVSGLTANTAYEFQLQATNTDGDSAFVTANATTLCNSPTNLTSPNQTSSGISLSWTAPAGGAVSYKLEHSANGSDGWVQIGGMIIETSYTDNTPSLTPDTTYYYKVSAVNAAGISESTDILPVKTLVQPPTPTNFHSTDEETDTSVTLMWTAATDAIGYALIPLSFGVFGQWQFRQKCEGASAYKTRYLTR